MTRVGVTGLIAGGTALAFACSSNPPPPPAAQSEGQCAVTPGNLPAPGCVPFAPDSGGCAAPSKACDTSPCTGTSACLAMGADNSGQTVASLRMRKLQVASPAVLASSIVQRAVVDDGIDLNGQCGEPGQGTFNWIMQLDTTKNTVTTGGAPPVDDPFTTPYCFVSYTVAGLDVAPVTVSLTKNADGTWTSGTIPKLYVPIFVPTAMQGNGVPSVVILPISGARVANVALTDGNDCIGHYNADAVTVTSAGCVDTDPTSCARWTTGGALGGYITLDEADRVDVVQLSKSLCVLLDPTAPVDTTNPNEEHCQKDSSGHVLAKGDYCSTTHSAGGCKDSVWLAATFAASAAKIGSANNTYCMGGGASDAGAGGGDAAADTGTGGGDSGGGAGDAGGQ